MVNVEYENYDQQLVSKFMSALREKLTEVEPGMFQGNGAFVMIDPLLLCNEKTFILVRCVYVDPDKRNQGRATKAIQAIIHAADTAQVPLLGYPKHFELDGGYYVATWNGLEESIRFTGECTENWESVLFSLGFQRNEWVRDHDMRHKNEFVVEYTPKTPEEFEKENARLEEEEKRIEEKKNYERTRLWRLRQRHPYEDINKLLTIYSI